MPAPLFKSPITLPQPPFAIEASDRSETAPRGPAVRRDMRSNPSRQVSSYQIVKAVLCELMEE